MKRIVGTARGVGHRGNGKGGEPSTGHESDAHPTSSVQGTSPKGIEILHGSSDSAALDICFVHGLIGNSRTTWSAQGYSEPWPVSLLPGRLDGVRILAYGYDACASEASDSSTNKLSDHAKNLLSELVKDRVAFGAQGRPLGFVAHGCGGLVVKEAMLLSQDSTEAHNRAVFESVKGIIFMGTPHRGPWTERWSEIPAWALGVTKVAGTSLLETLQTPVDHILSVQERFFGMLREMQTGDGKRISVTCAYEGLPMLGIGFVVSEVCATMEGCKTLRIHAHHSDMVRFASAGELGFRKILKELTRWQSDALNASSNILVPAEGNRHLTDDRMLDACAESLAFPEMEDRRLDILDVTDGTCHWLLRHASFKAWTQSQRGIVRIMGRPGSGKSVLMAFILKNTDMVPAMTTGSPVILSFFFHGQGAEAQKTLLGMYRSFLYQLLRKAPDVLARDNLMNQFRNHCELAEMAARDYRWIGDEPMLLFRSSLRKVLESRSVWLFVDALNECGQEQSMSAVEALTDLVNGVPLGGLQSFHLMFSSPTQASLGGDSISTIIMEDENHEDVAIYVRRSLPISHPSMPPDVPDGIINNACGNFLWARLAVEQVREHILQCVRGNDANLKLVRFPKELEGFYGIVLEQLTSQQSLLLIQWLCSATRPMTTVELRCAMMLETGQSRETLSDSKPDTTFPETFIRVDHWVRSLTCGLAEVMPGSETVQFIHLSIKEYISNYNWSRPRLAGVSHEVEASGEWTASSISHRQCAIVCLKYLSMEAIATGLRRYEQGPPCDDPDAAWPFLRYAAVSWPSHVKCQGDAEADYGYIQEFFSQESTLLETWSHVFARLMPHHIDRPPDKTTLLHVLARYGATGALRIALENGRATSIDARDGLMRTPLTWAVRSGVRSSAEMLLDHGALVDEAEGPWKRAPLYISMEAMRLDIAGLLLERGADIEAKEQEKGWTPLFLAVRNGSDVAMSCLLDHGASLEAIDDRGMTPLTLAETKGWQRAAQYLTQRGAERQAAMNERLFDAVREGREEQVRQVVHQGANIEARNEQGLTPFFLAITRSQWHLVPALIDLGANIMATDSTGVTPMYWAADTDNHHAAVCLLQHGAYIRIADSDRITRLGYTFCWNVEVADLLHCLYDAVPMAKGRDCISLTAAIGTGNQVAYERLLQSGVDVEEIDEYGLRALAVAVLKADLGCCKLLLDTGADVNSGKGDLNVLAMAIKAGHDEIVSLLLSRGANAEVVQSDDHGIPPSGVRLTALGIAIMVGRETIVQMLVDAGVNKIAGTQPVEYLFDRNNPGMMRGDVETIRIQTNAGIERLEDNRKRRRESRRY